MSAIIGIAALGSFTFHYVSINTSCVFCCLLQLLIFTFHYVSINTKEALKEIGIYTALHSTMFLLIQERPGMLAGIQQRLYIPLCFY